MSLVLASASPRRKALLTLLYADFQCLASDIDEAVRAQELPEDYVCRMAIEKAQACPVAEAVVLAADTSVTLNQQILGKPDNSDQARWMLQSLSGRTHQVLTAVAVRQGSVLRTSLVATDVDFVTLSTELIDRYLLTSEPWDKAGSYGIQGFAGSFVRAIRGSYSAVVGLPLAETRELLSGFGLMPTWSDTDA